MSSRIDPSLYPRLHEQLADRFGTVVFKLLPDIADALLAHAAEGLDANVAAKLTDTARLLREEAAVRAEIALENFVGIDLGSMSEESSLPVTVTDLGQPVAGADIGLLEQILARELASTVRSSFGGSYLNYLRRLESLAETPLRDDQHPLGARALALALIMALKPFTHLQPISLHLRPIVLAQAVFPLARLLADCDAALRREGVLPSQPGASLQIATPTHSSVRTLSNVPAATFAEHGESYTGIFPTEDLRNSFVQHASHQVLNDIRASAVMAANPLSTRHPRLSAHRNATRLPHVEDIERDAVAFAQHLKVAPFSQQARTRFFDQIRQQIIAAGGDTAVLAVVDLVSTLFDYAGSDTRLPEGARILLWRLQMPAITLASLDAGYLSDDSRSVRRLVEQLAAIAISYPEDMRPDKPLYQRLQTIVRAVEIVAHAFHIRSQVLTDQVDHEYHRATEGMRRLLSSLSRSRRHTHRQRRQRPNRRDFSRRPSPARERTVSEDIRRLLDHRLGANSIPASVRMFLYDVWLRHLRTAVLRDGTDSQAYRLALKVVDDLLWTLGREGADPRARTELVQSIPPMLQMISSGIRDVGGEPDNFRTFFDEIFVIHLRRIQGEEGSAATLIAREAAEVTSLPTGTAPQAGTGYLHEGNVRDAQQIHAQLQQPRTAPARARHDATQPAAPAAPEQGDAHPAAMPAGTPHDGQSSAPATQTAGTHAAGHHAPHTLQAAREAHATQTWPSTLAARVAAQAMSAAAAGAQAAAHPGKAGLATQDVRTHTRVTVTDGGATVPATLTGLDPASAAAARERLLDLIRRTRMDDLPNAPRRFNLPPERFASALAPGRWLELISRTTGRVEHAKVVWINERRSMVLLLLAPGNRIMTREISSLVKRARQGRVFFVW